MIFINLLAGAGLAALWACVLVLVYLEVFHNTDWDVYNDEE